MEGERTPLLHPSRQPDTAPEDEEEIVDGPRDCSQWRRQLVGIELAGCLHSFSSGLHEVIRNNLILEKVCRVNLNLPESVCDDIQGHDDKQVLIQQKATMLNLYITAIVTLPTVIAPLILGPWSDRHGRRMVMVLPVLGHMIAILVYLANVFFWSLPAEYLLLSSLYCLGGGSVTLYLGIYSSLADSTSSSSRTARVSILDVAIILGWSLGNLLSAIVFQNLGYYGVFGLTLGAQLLLLVFLMCYLPQSSSPQQAMTVNETAVPETPLSIFTVLRSPSVLFLLGVMVLYMAAGSADVSYLYTRVMFDWDEADFTKLSTLSSLLSSISSLLLLPFLSLYLEVPDWLLGSLACFTTAVSFLVSSLAHFPSTYVFSSCLGLAFPMVSSVARSLLSKQVPLSSLGSLYSALGGLEAAVPFFAAPLLTVLYNSSIAYWPGLVFLARSGIIASASILYLLVSCLDDTATPTTML